MDTVTLALEGDDIGLADFAQAVEGFSLLIAELSREGAAPNLRWEIAELSASSATTTARAVENGYEPDRLDQVIRSYSAVAKGLEERTTLPFSPGVQEAAERIAGVLRHGKGVEAIRFETAEADIQISEAPEDLPPQKKAPELVSGYGAVTGRIQTLSSRAALRFTLYDRLHDKAVGCYLREGQGDMVRSAWDKLATVEGWVTRDPRQGRPTAVRKIKAIHVLDPGSREGYKEARGALPHDPDAPLPEDRIRHLRDAS